MFMIHFSTVSLFVINTYTHPYPQFPNITYPAPSVFVSLVRILCHFSLVLQMDRVCSITRVASETGSFGVSSPIAFLSSQCVNSCLAAGFCSDYASSTSGGLL